MTEEFADLQNADLEVVDTHEDLSPIPERARQRQAFLLKDGVPTDLRPPWLSLRRYSAQLRRITKSVGQVSIGGQPLGTGFVVGPQLLMTNRHVAKRLATMRSDGVWGMSGPDAVIDFAEFPDPRIQTMQHEVLAVHHMSVEEEADYALLSFCSLSRDRQPPPPPLPLYRGQPSSPNTGRFVYVVGYPFEPGAWTDPSLLFEIFQGVYGPKRIQPGRLLAKAGTTLTYDCSTLKGNSGSPVLLLSRGEVAGLHYTGDRRRNTALSLWRSDEVLAAIARYGDDLATGPGASACVDKRLPSFVAGGRW